jgi:hypothetical protein
MIVERRNTESVERLEISEGLSYFVPDAIVMVVECCMRLPRRVLNSFVPSTLTDKAIYVTQNPMHWNLVHL